VKYKATRKKVVTRNYRWVGQTLIAIFLVLLPFIFSASGYDKFRLPKTTFAILSILVIGIVVALLGRIRLSFPLLSWETLLAGSTGYLALHTLTSSNPGLSWHTFLVILPFVVFFFVLRSNLTARFQRVVWLLVGSAFALSSILTVMQYHGLITSMTYQSGETLLGRINPAGFIGEVNSGGFLFGLVSVLLIYFVVAERDVRLRVLGGSLLAINLIGLAYTRTLTAFAALSACFVLWLIFHHWWTLRRNRGVTRALVYFWVVLALGLAGGTVVAVMSGIGGRVVSVAEQIAHGNLSAATAGRQPVYWLTWEMIREKPLLGRGLETFGHDFFYFRADTEVGQSAKLIHQEGSFQQVHNDYLQVAEELWLAGLALMLALLIIPVIRTVSLVRTLDDEADIYWNGMLGIAVVFVMVGALAFFPLRLTVTGSYVVLIFGCLRWYQCPDPSEETPRAREASWQLIPVVLFLSVLLLFVGLPLHRAWDANSKLGTASYLLEQVSSGQIPVRQKQMILGRLLNLLNSADAAAVEFPEIYNLKGGAYLLLGEYGRAAENYALAAERIPSAEVLTNLAAAQIAEKKNGEAEELLHRALRYDPQYTKAQQALQYLESQQ